jgi:hypothetical protein
MPDDVARALGTPGPTMVEIGGKQCQSRPLTMQELSEAERDCLKRYKREYLETFAENADLLPKGEGAGLLQEEMRKAAKWDINDLPTKHGHDPKAIKINRSIRKWLEGNFDVKGKTDESLKILAAAALDQETMTAEQYKEMVGARPHKVKIPYVNWWVTGAFDGMIALVFICFRHNGVTREEVAAEMIKNPTMMTELSREIESLSVPAVGNG